MGIRQAAAMLALATLALATAGGPAIAYTAAGDRSFPATILLPQLSPTDEFYLTPSTLPRNATGQYLVEMEIDTTQQTLIPTSVTPLVVVGFDSYPMRFSASTGIWRPAASR